MLEAAGIRLDPATRLASRSGRPLELARKEFSSLEVLLAAGGRVVSTEELLEKVWDENADLFTTAVRTTIKKLRRKLGDPDPIETPDRVRLPDPAVKPPARLTVRSRLALLLAALTGVTCITGRWQPPVGTPRSASSARTAGGSVMHQLQPTGPHPHPAPMAHLTVIHLSVGPGQTPTDRTHHLR